MYHLKTTYNILSHPDSIGVRKFRWEENSSPGVYLNGTIKIRFLHPKRPVKVRLLLTENLFSEIMFSLNVYILNFYLC